MIKYQILTSDRVRDGHGMHDGSEEEGEDKCEIHGESD